MIDIPVQLHDRQVSSGSGSADKSQGSSPRFKPEKSMQSIGTSNVSFGEKKSLQSVAVSFGESSHHSFDIIDCATHNETDESETTPSSKPSNDVHADDDESDYIRSDQRTRTDLTVVSQVTINHSVTAAAIDDVLDDVLLGQFGDLIEGEQDLGRTGTMGAQISRKGSMEHSWSRRQKKLSGISIKSDDSGEEKGGLQVRFREEDLEPSRDKAVKRKSHRTSTLKSVATSATMPAMAEQGANDFVDEFGAASTMQKSKSLMKRIAGNSVFVSFFMILTLYALFVPDLDLLCGDKTSKFVFSIVTFVVCIFFVVEVVVQSLGRRDYFLRPYFWLDLVAMGSLLPDTWLFESVVNSNAFVAGRSSRLSRIVQLASRSSRVTRLNRLTRIIRLTSLMPKIAALLGGRKIKDGVIDKMLEKKLLRVFCFLDEDQDGLVSRSVVESCLLKMGIEETPSKKGFFAWKLASSSVSTILTSPKSGNMSPKAENGMESKASAASFRADKSDQSSAPISRPSTPMRLSNTSASASPTARSKNRMATMGSKALNKHEDQMWVTYEEFRSVLLSDPTVSERLRRACQVQLKSSNNVQNLTSRHGEYIAVKVAFGVLLMLFVLSIVDPTIEDFSAEKGLKYITDFVRSTYGSEAAGDPISESVHKQVDVWRDGGGIVDRRILYLDLEKKVYCDELVHGVQPCRWSGSGVQHLWGERSRLSDIDDKILDSEFRISDLAFINVPDFSGEDLSEAELDKRTMSVVVVNKRGDTQRDAVLSILTTCMVTIIILSGIVLLEKDLRFLSQNLLLPLRTLADDMESMAQLQLVGDQDEDQIEWTDQVPSEVRAIRRTFENMKKAIKSWGKYVPWPVVQTLLRANMEADLEVEDLEVTMYFSDIANFTTIVENLSPDSSMLLLVRYFNDMSKVIDDHGGIVVEFIGDAIQCIYGAPLANPDHPTNAVKASIRMLSALRRMNEWCIGQDPPLPQVSIRCGVHTGSVLVGNMGFDLGLHSRMKYGIVGEDSHIPPRLEEANKMYGSKMIISQSTYDKLGENEGFITRPVDFIQLRENSEAEPIYEVLDRDKRHMTQHPLFPMTQKYASAMEEYRNRDFASAAKLFEEVQEMKKQATDQDDIASELMRKRCESYIETPPPEDWSGVWDR